jgi:hypothetical protein
MGIKFLFNHLNEEEKDIYRKINIEKISMLKKNLTLFPEEMPNTSFNLMNYEKKAKIIDDNSISYKYNNYGFRSDDFENNLIKDSLFAGCCVTHGDALPYDKVWSKIFYDKQLKYDGYSKYHNISRSGGSIETIVFDTLQYCKTFGNPENIFLLFPHFHRHMTCKNHIEGKRFFVQKTLENDDLKDGTLEDLVIKHMYFIKIIEDYCQKNNINLFYSSWHKETDYILNELSSNRGHIFLNYDSKNVLESKKKLMFEQYGRRARDGFHFGIAFHEYVADFFQLCYNKRKGGNNG